jgi:phospholipid transport system substrate-binding protein
MRWFVVAACLMSSISAWDATAWAEPSAQAEGPGVNAVRRANERVSALLKQQTQPGSAAEKRRAQEITEQLAGFLDVAELGERALVDHWGKLEQKQKKEYLTLLRALVEANYIKVFRNNVDYDIRYLKEEAEGVNRRVYTELVVNKPEGKQTIGVDYVLRPDGQGWRAFDIVTDGVGMIENYRSQFNKIIAKEGVKGLLERMRKKKAEAPA